MALLTDAERKQVWTALQRHWSNIQEPLGAVTKADLRAAVDALDAWIDANGTSLNTAIPLPARTELTAGQKALLLSFVVLRRFDVALLKKIIGEVD